MLGGRDPCWLIAEYWTRDWGGKIDFKAEAIKIPGPTSVRKLEVAFRPEGLVGIQIHLTDSESSCAGQHNTEIGRAHV